jgi:hypothetical protein
MLYLENVQIHCNMFDDHLVEIPFEHHKEFLLTRKFCLVLPVTKSLMSEMLKPVILTLKYPNDFTEIWFSNLFPDYLTNH